MNSPQPTNLRTHLRREVEAGTIFPTFHTKCVRYYLGDRRVAEETVPNGPTQSPAEVRAMGPPSAAITG